MKKIKILTCIAFLLQSFTTLTAQNWFQGLETGDNWSILSGADSISTDVGSSYTPANSTIRTGSKFWKVQNALDTLKLATVNISGTGNKVQIHLASISTTTGNGMDTNDTIWVYTSINGVIPTQADIILTGALNARWGYNATLVASTTAGTPVTFAAPQNGTSTNNYGTLEILIPNGTNSVGLTIITKNNSTGEILAFDDISLGGCTPPADPILQGDNAVCSPGFGIIQVVNVQGMSHVFADASGTQLITNISSVYTFSNVTTDTTFYIQADNGNCQSNIVPFHITLKPTPTSPTISPFNNPVCANTQVSLQANGTLTGEVFSWFSTPTGGTAIFTGNPYIFNASVTDTFWVESSLNGCKSPGRTMVIVDVLPQVFITGMTSTCTNQMVTYASSEPGNWLILNGVDGVDYNIIQMMGTTFVVQFLTPNSYPIQFVSFNGCMAMWQTFAQSCGCNAFMSGNIDSTGFGTFVGQNNFGANTTYHWVWGDGTTSNMGPTAQHQYTQSGTYNVCLYVSSPTCSDTICQTYNVLVNQTISGNIYFDANGNGVKDTGENNIPNITVTATNGSNQYFGVSNAQGNYIIYAPANSGNYTLSINPNVNFSITEPLAQTYTLSASASHTGKNFGLAPDQNMTEVTVSGWAGPARLGFTSNYLVLNICNNGTVNVTNTLNLQMPVAFMYVSSNPAAASVTGQNISWNYNLDPFECQTITIYYHIPTSVTIGSVHTFNATINPNPDFNSTNNVSNIPVTVVASYDPNDKMSDQVTTQEFGQNAYLDYTIRFQNVGTDTAFLVQVFDTLDTQLDVTSFEMIASSHNGYVEIIGGNIIRWTFQGINLPPSPTNDQASNGYVRFRIRHLSTLVPNFQIQNKAAIYFDFNEPVITNTVNNSFILTALDQAENNKTSVYPNPCNQEITLKLAENNQAIFKLSDVQGKIILTKEVSDFEKVKMPEVPGVYIYHIEQNGKTYTGKIVKL